MLQTLSNPLHGRRLLSQVLANPAAGAEIDFPIPAGFSWELASLHAYFQAAVGGGSRRFTLAFTVGIAPCQVGIIHDTVAATAANAFHWVAGFHEYFDFAAVLESYQGFPQGLILNAGDSWQTVTTNLQAGDQWSNVAISYYETLTP